MVYYTLCLDSVNRQKSRWGADEKLTFLKEVWHLKG